MHLDIHAHRILILDFGSQYTQLIARRVRELGVYCELRAYDMTEAEIREFNPKGIILSGGPESVTEAGSPRAPEAVFTLGLPLLGICYGHQLLAHALGGDVGYHPDGREMGTVEIDLHPPAADDPLFAGLPQRFPAQATHLQSVLRPPAGATVLARSLHDACHAFRWGERAWGLQFHPEFSATHMRGYIDARGEALREEGRCPKRLSRTISATPHARRVLRRFVRHARRGI